MKTIRKVLEEKLEENGLWPSEIKKIMDDIEIIAKIEYDARVSWNEDPEIYTPGFMVALWIFVKQQAIDWIDKNKPEHFARAILTEKS